MLDASALVSANDEGSNRVLGYPSGKLVEGVKVISLLGLMELVAEGS